MSFGMGGWDGAGLTAPSGGDGWSVAGNRGVQGCASPAGHGGWHSWSGVDQELVFHPLSMSKCGVKGS